MLERTCFVVKGVKCGQRGKWAWFMCEFAFCKSSKVFVQVAANIASRNLPSCPWLLGTPSPQAAGVPSCFVP